MIVKIYGVEHHCAKAIKGNDFIKLLDVNDNTILQCDGISSFDGYEAIDSDWISPPSTQEEIMQQYLLDLDYRLSRQELGV